MNLLRSTNKGPKTFEVKKSKLSLKYTKYGDRVKKFLATCGKGQTRRRRADGDLEEVFDHEVAIDELSAKFEAIQAQVRIQLNYARWWCDN